MSCCQQIFFRVIVLASLLASSSVWGMKYNFFLSRGLVREKRHWGDFSSRLKTQFPGSNVVLLELPGAGIYNKTKVSLRVVEIVEFMRRQYLGEKKKLAAYPNIILAMSFGGMIGTEWLFKYPNDFQYAVFGNTSFGGFCGTFQRFKPINILNAIRFPFAKTEQDREKLALEMISNRLDLRESTSYVWGNIRKDAPISMANAARQLYAAFTYRPPERIPETPILLLASKNDRLVDVACSEAIHTRWKVPIRLHDSAGHVIALDAPEWIVTEIATWLSGELKKKGH